LFAKLNIACAESSNSTASFDRASIFTQAAYRLICPELEELPELTDLARAIYLNYVIALYRFSLTLLTNLSSAKYSEALDLCKTFYSKSFCNKEFEMRFVSHECRILVFMGKNLESIARGLEGLSLLGITLIAFLKDPGLISTYETQLLSKINDATSETSVLETFKKLPLLKDDFILAAHSIIIELTAPLAYSAPHLFHTMSLFGLLLILEHGKSMHSAFHVPPTLLR
jgi:hypothetical protein